ncbi:MAG TPA: hypothetical protein DCX32_04185 [Candidatus Moranbacteria bacterium]|nr:MAG: hypothetical protein UW87_C0008G0013 [Candidatus Moranbacteria bacterium GW2011_GWC2_45_10]KKT93063.1 MAG: hypothetical protein UW95_C0026G0004 [Parcubacteria group bacterium GW2011_GWC1_45_14]HAV11706.1 hypothetical protein [Candidatus Moranbacteria bacterium]
MEGEYNKKLQDIVLLVLRLVIAAIFLFAAWAKWQYISMSPDGVEVPMEKLTKFLMIVEPLGAVALIGGFLTRSAAAGLAMIMVGAVFVLRITAKSSLFTGQEGIGLDYNLLILAGCLVLAAFGPGRWSIDAMRK